MIRVIGGLVIETRRGAVRPPGGQVGALLRDLLVSPNRSVHAIRLIERLWPNVEPDELPSARNRLYVVVNRLRRFLGDLDVADTSRLELVTESHGYRLVARPEALDRVAFEQAASAILAGTADGVDVDLAWWRGEPYAGFPDTHEVQDARARLTDLRRELQRRDVASGLSAVDIARTQLLRPSATFGVVVRRERLLGRIGRAGERQVAWVTAPAGYGKTVLLAQWADAQAGAVAWVSLGPADADPVRFWSLVWESLVAAGVLGATTPPHDAAPGSDRFVAAVIDAIAATGGESIGLVLDDAHHVADAKVLTTLLELPVAVPGRLTVVVGSRRRPAAPATERRGGHPRAGRQVAVDASHLRFTAAEIAQVASLAGYDGSTERLASVTAGWPIAVTHLSSATRRDAGLDRVTLDSYMITEVLDSLPTDVRRFLVETAPLDRLSADLVDAITGRTDGRNHLEWLLAGQLLIDGRASEVGWYRCHPLMRRLLRELAVRDPEVDVAEVHRRAGRWFRSAGMPEPELEHAIASDDAAAIADVAGEVIGRAMLAGQAQRCEHWLRKIDPDAVAGNRATHDLLTLAATWWLGPDARAEWLASRLRQFGAGDLLLTVEAAQAAYRAGTANVCTRITEQALARVDRYFEQHPNRPGMRAMLIGSLQMSQLSARILAGELHADDPELEAFATRARSDMSVMLPRILGEWAFLALVEERFELAAELLAEIAPRPAAVADPSMYLSAGRLIVAQALVESARARDRGAQVRIAERLRPIADEYRRLRWHVELVPVLLALQVVVFRAGDLSTAEEAGGEADLLLTLFENAHLLARARVVFQPGRTPRPAGRPSRDAAGATELSERERTVLEHLGAGLTYRQIAQRLGLSQHTVSGHVTAAYRKLGVHSRQDAIRHLRAKGRADGRSTDHGSS